MELLKGLISRCNQLKMIPQRNDELVPHLVPKYNQRKTKKNKTASKPLPRYLTIEMFHESELPDIVLRPPTPPRSELKVEELLFERSGSVFILRGPRAQRQLQSTMRPGVEHLQVPRMHRTVERCEKAIGVSGQDRDGIETEDQDLDLHCASQSDYRTFMAGLEM